MMTVEPDCSNYGLRKPANKVIVRGFCTMTAKLATVDECILAGIEDGYGVSDGNIIARCSSDKQQAGGMELGCGYLSPFFITDPERMEVVFENAYILIHEGIISSRKDLLPLLEQMTKIGKPLLIIAEDVGSEALATLVVNKLSGPLQVVAVRAPGFGDERKRLLQELSILAGGKVIAADFDTGLNNIEVSDLGQSRRATVRKNSTLVEGRAQYDQFLFESEARIPSAQSSPTAIYC
jgi:chaperonin GroEL (HSP60 family)